MYRLALLLAIAAVAGFPAIADTPDSDSSQRVMLGSDLLVQGIPGEGALTGEQITKWLAEPTNHLPLEIRLPLGLDAGAANVYIPDDNPLTRAKIELGRQLYFDARLSSDSSVSCASCHDPEMGFSAHTTFGIGVEGQTGNRNSPVSYNRILSREQFWDGRADSLEDQAVGPIANPIEMGSSHESCVACLEGIEGYRQQFSAIFDDGITIDNVGRALAAFERVIVTGPTPYDYAEPLRNFEQAFALDLEDLDLLKEEDPEFYEQYQELKAAAEANPLSESAARGRDLFFGKANCSTCHAGANFADEQYHNLGVGMEADEPDLGRFEVTEEEKDKGAFKTPTVRNVVHSPPYMHDGSQETLAEVVEWYDKGGHPNEWLSDKMKPLKLNDQEKADLVEFMTQGLTGKFPKVETGRLPL